MKNLMELPSNTRHPQLASFITAYNQHDFNHQKIEKIFLLQKINHFLETSIPDLELTEWRTSVGNSEQSSWEVHLQRFGISRDGSTLVKNIQFAEAVSQNAPPHPIIKADYFAALQARDALLANPTENIDETQMANYIKYNQSIMLKFDADPDLQQQYNRSQYFLSLCYAKMEAIRGAVTQDFDTFQTNQLGDRIGNNRNFTLNIEGEEKQLVLRVEDRNSLVTEQILQTYPVSEYFSEDYYMMMLPFNEGFQEVYRPVALSEYVEKGSLEDYALILRKLSPADVRQETQTIFLQLCDFCIKLQDAGHYHPDIKLSNFLTDGQTIKVSDRKTITAKKNPKASEVSSTPTYSPPEYKACINKTNTGVNIIQASRITLDMPSFMSYQLGMALKEFVMSSTFQIDQVTPELFLEWIPISAMVESPSKTQKNYFALIQELTRNNPQDRLSIDHFQTLLAKIHLPHSQFLNEIETLAPQTDLSHSSELALMKQLIQAPHFTPSLRQQWHELEQKGIATQLYSDPRNRFFEHATQEVKDYLKKIEKIIAAENRKKASSIRLVGSFFGTPVPEVAKIEELPALPVMPEKIKWYFEILEELPTPMLTPSDMDKLRHIHMRQEGLLALQTIDSTLSMSSSLTTSPDDSPNYSPIGDLRDSPELEADTHSQFDSGTFVRLPENARTQEDDATEEIGDFDSGTFRRVPNKSSITEMDDTPLEENELDTGTFVVRKPVPHSPNPAEGQKGKQSHMKHIIKNMQAQDAAVDKQVTSPKASDIDTTIKRGNKGK